MDKLAWNELLERATHFDLEYGVPREYSTYQKEKTVPFKLFETEYESLSEVLDLVEAFTTHDSLGGIVFWVKKDGINDEEDTYSFEFWRCVSFAGEPNP